MTLWVAVLIGACIEPPIILGRLFREEISQLTLSSLVLLPWDLSLVLYSKLAGAMLGLMPLFTWAAVAIALDPAGAIEFVEENAGEPGLWMTLSLYVLFLHLVAYLSLHLKWGAIPLSFVICVLLPWMIMIFTVLLWTAVEENFAYIMIGGIALLGCGLLHYRTAVQLRAIAAQ